MQLLFLQPKELVYLPLFFAVLFCLFFIRSRHAKSRRNVLLLVGPAGSGKTSIFSRLTYGQFLPTHTSLQPNVSTIALREQQKMLRIIDIPGHPRLREQFKEHIKYARVIAFVTDASTISRNGAAVAEHLHHVMHALTSLPRVQQVPRLLILAHKTDLAGEIGHSILRVKSVLERELQKRRSTQSGVGVDELGGEGEKSEIGGLEMAGSNETTFRFDDWDGGEVIFLGASSKSNQTDQDSLKIPVDGFESFKDWLDENI